MNDSGFLLDDTIIYLNHAAVSPWPRCTADAVSAFADENATIGSSNYPAWVAVETRVRQQLQQLINADSSDEIALLKNTSEALSAVAYGLKWSPGDNVVITNQEFPSNRIVWESLASQEVETRPADITSSADPENAIIECIDRQTRLVSVSSVQYATGLRLDLDKIGRACRNNKVLFCVDAIQSLGALEFDAQACQADFVMADAHKWMMAPEGIALFYCRAEVMEQLELKQFGWHMVEDHMNFDNANWELANSARRFECGSPNMTGIHALHASLGLILETGISAIAGKVLDNSRYLFEYFNRNPSAFELITPQQPGHYGGIVSFRPLQQDIDKLFARLTANHVVCALRGGSIRFSPHFYTPRNKLDQALQLLAPA